MGHEVERDDSTGTGRETPAEAFARRVQEPLYELFGGIHALREMAPDPGRPALGLPAQHRLARRVEVVLPVPDDPAAA